MIAKNVTRETLEAAAKEIGVALDMTRQNQKGDRWRVKINPLRSALKDEEGNRPYQAIRIRVDGHERRTFAVCWHGFRDFFRAVYRREPGAVFQTALDTWRGSDDFEARYRYSGSGNAGCAAFPVPRLMSCRCKDSGDY